MSVSTRHKPYVEHHNDDAWPDAAMMAWLRKAGEWLDATREQWAAEDKAIADDDRKQGSK